VRLTSLALQVHGGMGYIEETGNAQRFRDSRIAPIYEGTSGIQAIDLVSRKILRDRGGAMQALVADLQNVIRDSTATTTSAPAPRRSPKPSPRSTRPPKWLLGMADHREDWLAAATAYLDFAALTISGALMARQALWARTRRPAEEADAVAGRFRFFVLERVTQVPALAEPVTAGADRLALSYLA